MAKQRRDAVSDVLGDESPLIGQLDNFDAPSPPKQEKPEPKPPRFEQSEKTVKKPIQSIESSPAKSKSKRVLVTAEEEETMDMLLLQISRQVNTKVQFSQLTRAMWSLLLEAEDVIDRVDAPSLKRPSNGSDEGMAEFEDDLGKYLLDVFRAARRRSM